MGRTRRSARRSRRRRASATFARRSPSRPGLAPAPRRRNAASAYSCPALSPRLALPLTTGSSPSRRTSLTYPQTPTEGRSKMSGGMGTNPSSEGGLGVGSVLGTNTHWPHFFFLEQAQDPDETGCVVQRLRLPFFFWTAAHFSSSVTAGVHVMLFFFPLLTHERLFLHCSSMKAKQCKKSLSCVKSGKKKSMTCTPAVTDEEKCAAVQKKKGKRNLCTTQPVSSGSCACSKKKKCGQCVFVPSTEPTPSPPSDDGFVPIPPDIFDLPSDSD